MLSVLLGGLFGTSYVLTPLVMATSAVSDVISARQVSVVVGTAMGV